MLPSDGGSSETSCHCRGVGGGDEGDMGKRLWGNTEEYGSPLEESGNEKAGNTPLSPGERRRRPVLSPSRHKALKILTKYIHRRFEV